MKTITCNNTADWDDFVDNIHYFNDELIELFSTEDEINVETGFDDFFLTKEQWIGTIGKDELIELLLQKIKDKL